MMEGSVDREQLSLQQRSLRVDTAALCDDVENALGDVLCDGLDEIEEVLLAEDTVMQPPEQIRDVRGATPRPGSLAVLPRATPRHHTPLAVAERG
jgi:hypothetical protein|eukprot:COSAG02_NODE_7418_length_3025_cov_2.694017_5_plen_95_part_00